VEQLPLDGLQIVHKLLQFTQTELRL